ncbi:MAG: hypothetical protein ABI855_19890 [Bacteroidota bacterium]
MKTKIFILLLLVSFASCKKPNTYPSEPKITFKELVKNTDAQGLDESADLTISFVDGDGDIGLAESDTMSPYNPESVYYYDFYISFFIKHNGIFEEYPLAIPSSQRIPLINHEGKDRSLSGDIIMHLDFLGFPFNNDTLRFDAYIYDRALHKSNTITTSEIILKTL